MSNLREVVGGVLTHRLLASFSKDRAHVPTLKPLNHEIMLGLDSVRFQVCRDVIRHSFHYYGWCHTA